MTWPSTISIGAGSEPVAIEAGNADATGDADLLSTTARTNAGPVLDGVSSLVQPSRQSKPRTASRSPARQPNSCCGLRP
jgi:hypothetical protein